MHGRGGGISQVWVSNARWSLEVYRGMDGSGVSTDTHRSQDEALAVCNALCRQGFGGQRKDFPLETWVSRADEPHGPLRAVLVSADNGRPGSRVLEREDRHDHEANNHEDDAGRAEQVLRPRRVS